MNSLVKKEIRLMLPAFGAAIILAAAAGLLLNFYSYDGAAAARGLFLLGIVFLAVSTFGSEVGHRTLSLLLAQPVRRQRIWWTKLLVLALLIGICCEVASLCLFYHPGGAAPRTYAAYEDWLATDSYADWLTMTLPMVAGALYFTLLLRQVAAPLLLALLIPISADLLLTFLNVNSFILFLLNLFYSVACFVLARRQFLGLQDTGWTGGLIALETGISSTAVPDRVRIYLPWRAIVRKEWQMLQITLLGMGLLFLLHWGTVVVRIFAKNSNHFGGLDLLQFFGVVWFFVPVLAGSQMVADERQFGTFEALACLPVSRAKQFRLKLFLVALMGGLLSAGLLVGIESVAQGLDAYGPKGNMGFSILGMNTLQIFGIMLALAVVSLFASTLSRNLLSALATSLGASVLLGGYFVIGIATRFGEKLWPALALPVLLATLIWLAYKNYLVVVPNGRTWRHNILVLVVVMAALPITASAVYHRAWERFATAEEMPGPIVLRPGGPILPPHDNYQRISVLLPDGKLWEELFRRFDEDGRPSLRSFPMQIQVSTNVVQEVSSGLGAAAITASKSLLVRRGPRNWTQASKDLGWKSLAPIPGGEGFLCVKEDGSMWELYYPEAYPRRGGGTTNLTLLPLDMGTNWDRLLPGIWPTYAWKKDGTAWVTTGLTFWDVKTSKMVRKTASDAFERCAPLDNVSLQEIAQTWLSVSGQWLTMGIGLRTDGTLALWGPLNSGSTDIISPGAVLSRIGGNDHWAGIAGGNDFLAGLKTDGTIWVWRFAGGGRYHVQTDLMAELSNRFQGANHNLNEEPEQLGHRHDWAGITCWDGEIISLAGDGTLWEWPDSDATSRDHWLARSALPAKIVNILPAAK